MTEDDVIRRHWRMGMPAGEDYYELGLTEGGLVLRLNGNELGTVATPQSCQDLAMAALARWPLGETAVSRIEAADEFRTCRYCGCTTNARLHRCCDVAW